jgi:pyridoxamine 5'-phosphate oxidase
MIQKETSSLDHYTAQIDLLLNRALQKIDQLHWITLSSVQVKGGESLPDARTVVLRKILKKRELVFYTDKRSPKVAQFERNKNAVVLLYDHTAQMQLRIKGTIEIDAQSALFENVRDQIPNQAKVNYNTLLAPGSALLNENPDRTDEAVHFALVRFHPHTFDLLHLTPEGGKRIEATNTDDGMLSDARWLVP